MVSQSLCSSCSAQCSLSNLKPDWDKRVVCLSAWCALSFVGLGTCLVIVSPTMLDIAAYVGVGLAEIAAMLLVRSVGSVVGSVGAGILFDKFYKYSLWIIVNFIIFGGMLTCVIPLSTHLSLLGVIMFFHGLLLGGLDTGMHAFLMGVWKNKDSGPVFQLIHFTFAVGAFLAPLIARPFISSQAGAVISNITCLELFTMNVTEDNNCMREMQENCSLVEASGSYGELQYQVVNNCVSTASTTFRYAYWVAAIPLFVSLPALIMYAIKRQCCCLLAVTGQSQEKENEINEQHKSYPDTIAYKAVLLILLFFLILLYVGAEVSYGTYIFAYAVKGGLQFSKDKATILSSVFWGTFAFFRFFSISLSLCKVSPSIMLTGNLTGSLIASLIVVIWPNNELAIWIGSALMGASFASIYPNIVVWLIQHGPATGKATSVLSAGATIGDTTLPVIVGVLIAEVGPVSLCYYILANITLCCGIFIALFFIARKCKVKHGVDYYQLQLAEEEQELAEMNNNLIELNSNTASQNENDEDKTALLSEELSTET